MGAFLRRKWNDCSAARAVCPTIVGWFGDPSGHGSGSGGGSGGGSEEIQAGIEFELPRGEVGEIRFLVA